MLGKNSGKESRYNFFLPFLLFLFLSPTMPLPSLLLLLPLLLLLLPALLPLLLLGEGPAELPPGTRPINSPIVAGKIGREGREGGKEGETSEWRLRVWVVCEK